MQAPIDAMGNILAAREFSWVRGDGVTIHAYAEIGFPFPYPPLNDGSDGGWGCNVRTRGLDDNRIDIVNGVDAIQALYHALIQAGTRTGNSIVAKDLDWAALPNYGFPAADSGQNGVAPAAACVPCQ